MHKQDHIAIDAVARRFSEDWERGNDPAAAYIVIATTRIAIEAAKLALRGTRQGWAANLRLRFDKVATRLLDRLQATLGAIVPHGRTVLLTITAPIQLPSKTAAALETTVQTLLGPGSRDRDEKETIHGNRVRIRLVRHESAHAPSVIGFVHNSDSDPLLLLNIADEMLQVLLAKANRRLPRPADRRWLALLSPSPKSHLGVYRHICAQLMGAIAFGKVFLVSPDGGVELLGDESSLRPAPSSPPRKPR